MRVDHVAVLDPRLDGLRVGLHHVQRPGLAALLADVHEDERVVAAHHLVGEVEPTGAEVGDRDPGRLLALPQALGDRAAEAVVAQPEVADGRDEDLLLRGRGRHQSFAPFEASVAVSGSSSTWPSCGAIEGLSSSGSSVSG